jgi:putative transposase|tara:strand:+ start:104 stop:400 length:297 start_codon:yes stop_codon:yes gene_type:complete
MKRTKQQWLELIQAQQTSDLSIVDFCREKDLPLKSFYARRSSLLKPKHTGSSAFSKVAVAEKIQSSSAEVTLSIGKATLSIPSSTDVVWLAKLIGQFA